MKRRVYLLGVCLLIGGLITAVLGYINGGENRVFFSGRGRVSLAEEKVLRVDEQLDFDSLDIQTDVMDVEIVLSDKFFVDASYYSIQDVGYAVENGVLKITALGYEGAINIGVTFYQESNRLKIGIPGKLDGLTIKSDVGSVHIGAIAVERANIKSDVGSVEIGALRAETLDVKSATGSIELNGTDFDKLSAHSNVGSVELKLPGKYQDYDLDLSTNVGSIIRPIGDNPRGPRMVKASTNVGSIEVHMID